MGLKNIKNHLNIKHHIQLTEQGICIGSSFIHDIIVVKPDGTCVNRYPDRSNEDLVRYQKSIDENPALFKELFERPDDFSASIPVFTYDGSTIIENACEVPGWPNTTHDGKMMYENMYSTDKNQVVIWAKQNASASLECHTHRIAAVEKELIELKLARDKAAANLRELNEKYPKEGPKILNTVGAHSSSFRARSSA